MERRHSFSHNPTTKIHEKIISKGNFTEEPSIDISDQNSQASFGTKKSKIILEDSIDKELSIFETKVKPKLNTIMKKSDKNEKKRVSSRSNNLKKEVSLTRFYQKISYKIFSDGLCLEEPELVLLDHKMTDSLNISFTLTSKFKKRGMQIFKIIFRGNMRLAIRYVSRRT